MKKIPSIFLRDFEGNPSLVTDVRNPECDWVFRGEGIPTRKYDGTALLMRDGIPYARYDAKNGKTPPVGFEACQDPDPKTGHWPGWVPACNDPKHYWILVAVLNRSRVVPQFTRHSSIGTFKIEDGTYEVCGPHFQGNPEDEKEDCIFRHGVGVLHINNYAITLDSLRRDLKGRDIEGVVWHHKDGRMAKIKKSDLGMSRKD